MWECGMKPIIILAIFLISCTEKITEPVVELEFTYQLVDSTFQWQTDRYNYQYEIYTNYEVYIQYYKYESIYHLSNREPFFGWWENYITKDNPFLYRSSAELFTLEFYGTLNNKDFVYKLWLSSR